MKRRCFSIGIATFIFGLLLSSCSLKTTENADATTKPDSSVVLRDSIVSFEALFAPGKYNTFLGRHWSEGCINYLYPIEKALSMGLSCPCTGIFPTIANGSITISLNNINCFPPEVEDANFNPNYQVTLPLDSLRPYLNETGARIVFESGNYLQDWLAKRKKAASVVEASPYTLYISLIDAGTRYRVVLQSKEGENNQEGTITGYYERDDKSKIEVTGYRTWGGFVVYDRTKDANSGLQFTWDDQAQGDDTHPVQNRFLSASTPSSKAYIDHVKLIGAFTLYEGPEDKTRAPENGVTN